MSNPASKPPHQAELVLTDLTEDEFDTFHLTAGRAFHEELSREYLDLQRAAREPGRFFGFRAYDRWISTIGSFAQRVTVPGGAQVPVAAVTDVTVHSAYRRRGLMRKMMNTELRRTRERGEAAAVLYATESGIYGRFGYGNAAPVTTLSGPTDLMKLGRDSAEQLQNAGGSVDEVDKETYLALAGPLYQEILELRPGMLSRPDAWWEITVRDTEADRNGATPLRFIISYDDAGEVDGHATYRVKGDWSEPGTKVEMHIGEVMAASGAGYSRIWSYLANVDLVQDFRVGRAAVDSPLLYLLENPRVVRSSVSDGLYVRIVNIEEALTARSYAAPVDVVLDIDDNILPENDGSFRLTADASGATVTRTDDTPDLSMKIRELGGAYLGGVSLGSLHAAGLVEEHREGAVAQAATAFGWSIAPFCPDSF